MIIVNKSATKLMIKISFLNSIIIIIIIIITKSLKSHSSFRYYIDSIFSIKTTSGEGFYLRTSFFFFGLFIHVSNCQFKFLNSYQFRQSLKLCFRSKLNVRGEILLFYEHVSVI